MLSTRKQHLRQNKVSKFHIVTTRAGLIFKQLFLSPAGAPDFFSPDLVIWVAGADNHSNDLIGNMILSVSDMQRRDDVIIRAFIKNCIPLAILYGGGYSRQPEFTANTIVSAKKSLGNLAKVMSRAPLPSSYFLPVFSLSRLPKNHLDVPSPYLLEARSGY